MRLSESRYSISARLRSSPGTCDREISGFEEIAASRWSPAIRSPRERSWNTVSVALCPGRKPTSSVRPANSSASPSESDRVTFAPAPQARNARETDASARATSSEMPWRSIVAVAKSSSAPASSR